MSSSRNLWLMSKMRALCHQRLHGKQTGRQSINAEISDWTPEDLLDLAVISRALRHAGSMNTSTYL